MPSTPPQLDLFKRNGQPAFAQRLEHRLNLDVRELTLKLTGRGWVIKSELMRDLGWSERRVQDAKQASNGQIISTSDRGYCLMSEATIADADHAIAEQTTRIKTMGRTLTGMIRARHALQPQQVAA